MSPTTVAAEVPPTDTPEQKKSHALLGIAFSVLSAVMLFTMWASHGNIWPFVFIGLVPMFIAQYRLMPRRGAPWAVGISMFGYWLALALDGGAVLGIALVLVIATLMALLWTGIASFERKFTERTNYKWFIAQFALLWTAFELVAQDNLVLGSNFFIEYRTASVPWMIQPVSLFSTPAWGFIIIMFNATIALLIMKWMDRRWPDLTDKPIPDRTLKWSAITGFGAMVVWIIASVVLYAQVNASLGPQVRVAAVQSGIQNTTSSGLLGEGGRQGTPADVERNAKLQAQLTAMTKQAAEQGAKLVVWPEEELDYDVREDNKGAWVGELAKETQTTIVSGFMPNSPSLKSPNLATVWYPDGQMSDQFYTKEHQVIMEGEAFRAGKWPVVFPTDVGRLGVIICFDHDFPDTSARWSVIAGANIIAAPAIDPYSIANLRWQSLVFRAVENRVPMVKTDVGYDSAIVNANGVVMERVATMDPAGSTNLLVQDVNLGPRNAPFTQTGSYPLMVVILLLLGARIIRQIYLRRRDGK